MQGQTIPSTLRRGLAALGTGTVISIGAASWAATSTGNLTVTATVSNSCSIATSALDFSLLNVGAATNEATAGEVEVTCTASQTGTTVTIDGGQHVSAGQRRLESGGSFVPYNIYTDAGRSSAVAENGAIYSGNISAATPQTIMVYGQVPSGTYVAGSYTDVVTVTLTY